MEVYFDGLFNVLKRTFVRISFEILNQCGHSFKMIIFLFGYVKIF